MVLLTTLQHFMFRSILPVLVLAFGILSLKPWYLHAGETPFFKKSNVSDLKKPSVEPVVEKGLKWLVDQQDVSGGYFAGSLRNTYTALACIALMSAGKLPGRSQYGKQLSKGIMFLISTGLHNKGSFGNEGENTQMYTQGICTLALSEAYGMMDKEDENRRILKVLKQAVAVILKSQCRQKGAHFGGWRYHQNSKDYHG